MFFKILSKFLAATYSCVHKARTMPLCPSRVFTHLYVVKVSHTLKKQEQETPSEEKINLKHFKKLLFLEVKAKTKEVSRVRI